MKAKDTITIGFFAIVRGVAWLLLSVAGISFFGGGRAIHEYWHIDRLLAELLGLGITVVFGVFGALLKAYTED